MLTDPWTLRGDKRPYKNRKDITDDLKLCIDIRKELESADIIVGWNSIRHDLSLLDARLVLMGERPCKVGEKHGVWHLDLMYYVGDTALKIGGRKLETAARFLGLSVQKTPLDGKTWQQAAAGNKNAMDDIVTHCEHDVLVLREAWPFLVQKVKKFQFTLSEVAPFITEIPSRRNG